MRRGGEIIRRREEDVEERGIVRKGEEDIEERGEILRRGGEIVRRRKGREKERGGDMAAQWDDGNRALC